MQHHTALRNCPALHTTVQRPDRTLDACSGDELTCRTLTLPTETNGDQHERANDERQTTRMKANRKVHRQIKRETARTPSQTCVTCMHGHTADGEMACRNGTIIMQGSPGLQARWPSPQHYLQPHTLLRGCRPWSCAGDLCDEVFGALVVLRVLSIYCSSAASASASSSSSSNSSSSAVASWYC